MLMVADPARPPPKFIIEAKKCCIGIKMTYFLQSEYYFVSSKVLQGAIPTTLPSLLYIWLKTTL